jgi:hypothetical protein
MFSCSLVFIRGSTLGHNEAAQEAVDTFEAHS